MKVPTEFLTQLILGWSLLSAIILTLALTTLCFLGYIKLASPSQLAKFIWLVIAEIVFGGVAVYFGWLRLSLPNVERDIIASNKQLLEDHAWYQNGAYDRFKEAIEIIENSDKLDLAEKKKRYLLILKVGHVIPNETAELPAHFHYLNILEAFRHGEKSWDRLYMMAEAEKQRPGGPF